MAPVTDDALRALAVAVLRKSDMASLSLKGLRRQLESSLGVDLKDRRPLLESVVDAFLAEPSQAAVAEAEVGAEAAAEEQEQAEQGKHSD